MFHQNKEELIAAMNKELEKIPGVIWNFSQPIADNMEEAVSGVKGELAVKLYGTDLRTLEATAQEIINVMRTVPGRAGPGPVPRDRAAEPELHGEPRQGRALPDQRRRRAGRDPDRGGRQRCSRRCCRASSATTWCCATCRSSAIPRRRSRTSGWCRPAASAFRWRSSPTWRLVDGAAEIYREGSQRYVAIKYGVRGRDLGSTVEEAIEGDPAGEAARRIHHQLGRRICQPAARAAPADADHSR